MKLVQVMLCIISIAGTIGNSIFFLYIEWMFLRQDFLQILNPFLHFQVFGVLFITPVFWLFLVMSVVGYYGVRNIERYFNQRHSNFEVKTKKVYSQSSEVFQEILFNDLSPLTQPDSISLETSSQRASQPVVEDSIPLNIFPQRSLQRKVELEEKSFNSKVELLEWAIQSSQKVRFNYENQNGEKSDRTVTPVRLKTFGQTLCLDSYCHLRRAKRNFSIQRMRDVRIVSPTKDNYGQSNLQAVVIPSINTQDPVSVVPESAIYDISKIKNTDAYDQSRSYISFNTEKLEKLSDLEWNNLIVLNNIHHELGFRSKKKAIELRKRIEIRLDQLRGDQFVWPTTTANTSSRNILIDSFQQGGILSHYGYKVGVNGLSEKERRKILDTIFLRPLINIDNVAYLSKWGTPNSPERLKKMANSIAAFIRLTKRRKVGNFSKAIQDWESDLAYLKTNYYKSRYSFQYPRI